MNPNLYPSRGGDLSQAQCVAGAASVTKNQESPKFGLRATCGAQAMVLCAADSGRNLHKKAVAWSAGACMHAGNACFERPQCKFRGDSAARLLKKRASCSNYLGKRDNEIFHTANTESEARIRNAMGMVGANLDRGWGQLVPGGREDRGTSLLAASSRGADGGLGSKGQPCESKVEEDGQCRAGLAILVRVSDPGREQRLPMSTVNQEGRR